QNCYDKLEECAKNAADGDCENDPDFMLQNCRGSCQLFSDQGGAVVRYPCMSDQYAGLKGMCIPSSVWHGTQECIYRSLEKGLIWINEVPSKGPSCRGLEIPDRCYDVCHPICQTRAPGPSRRLARMRCKPGYVRTDSYLTRGRCVRAHGFSTKWV
ncbi:unnamed protein product, partial [Meganyctiphanes norvegica]